MNRIPKDKSLMKSISWKTKRIGHEVNNIHKEMKRRLETKDASGREKPKDSRNCRWGRASTRIHPSIVSAQEDGWMLDRWAVRWGNQEARVVAVCKALGGQTARKRKDCRWWSGIKHLLMRISFWTVLRPLWPISENRWHSPRALEGVTRMLWENLQ
jgi:hypothetical protein